MDREARKSFLIASAMAFCLGFSGAACIVTGLEFPEVNLGEIAVFCGAFALISGALICLVKRGGWYFAAAGCLALGYLWRKGTLLESTEALLYHISSRYHQGYGTPVIRWSESELPAAAMTPALCILAGLVMLAVILVISNRVSAALAVIPALLPLAACLVLTDTLPDIWCLAVMIGTLVLLILTNTVRRRSRIDGNRLTARLLIPSLLLTTMLFWAVPQQRQELFTEANLQDILGMLQELPFVQMDATGTLRIEFGTIDTNHYPLDSVGPNALGNYRVMTVRSERGGTVYLRGQAYDLYDGKNWNVSDLGRRDQYPAEDIGLVSDIGSRGWRTWDMVNRGTVTVTTRRKHFLYYTPYFLGDEELCSLVGGRLPNPDGSKEYSFVQYVPDTDFFRGDVSMSARDFSAYTQLPDSSMEKLNRIANAAVREYYMDHAISGDFVTGSPRYEIYPGDIAISSSFLSPDLRAQAVGAYVRESARYDLMTGYMPEDAEDFALWFLEESETGYCIHFATAAAALLRSLGVPARLVTGYAMRMEPGQDTVVTADKAHAWVEYFSDYNGWRILDPTPGSVGDPSRVPTVEPTEPDITESPTTEPTQPTETTVPETESTEPAQTNPATASTEGPNQQNPSRPTEAPTVPTEQPPEDVDMGVILKILGWVGGVFCFLAVLIGQAELRLWLRQRRWKRKNGNARCIGLWREIEYRCTVLRLKPDPQVVEIAEKAKFSQHSISREEWREMKQLLARTSQYVLDSPWYRKIVFILIFAIR